MTDITVTLTQDEVQYLINAMDTHTKARGLSVAISGAVLLAKFQAAANGPTDGANGKGATD